MSNVFQQYNVSPWVTAVRTVQATNLSGTYSNGPLNNGVGATLTIAASSLTIDSVVMRVGDRFLLTGQSSANQNGIYVVNSIGATVICQRSADMQSIEQIKTGFYVTIGAGTDFAGSAFVVVEPLPAIFGINNLTFDQPTVQGSAPFVVLGNITAGNSGTSGTLTSYPATASEGFLTVAAVNNSGGNFSTTISNASSVGQNQTVSIPDGGASTSNFIISNSSGTQSIATGNLTMTAGNLQAGTSGHVGTVTSFPGTASKGSLILAAVNNTGNTNTTISNAAMGQASVISIPDPAGATANFVVAPAALVSGNLVSASGTVGLIQDTGISFNYINVPVTLAQFLAMYATPFQIIAAPGSGKLIIVARALVYQTYGSAGLASGGIVGLQYGNTAHLAGILATNTEQASDFTGAAANTSYQFVGASGNGTNQADGSNTAIYISNQTGAFTTGTGSTFNVHVWYYIMATP